MHVPPVSEADQIRQEMVRVRSELHDDVGDVVASARALTDWKQYVRSYPWICLGLAAAAGYWIVPARRKAPPPIIAAPAASKSKTKEAAVESGVKAGATAGILGSLISTAGTLALKGAVNFATRRATDWLNAKMSPRAAEQPGASAPKIYHEASTDT
jgi:hypothetical protein